MNRQLPTFTDAEDHVKISHFTRQGFEINGIVHVGTHSGYETQYYQQMGIDHVIGFEPLSKFCDEYNTTYPWSKCWPIALSDHDGTDDFYVTNDGAFGQCSSLLEPEESIENMTSGIKEIIKVPVMRFDHFVNTNKVENASFFDTLVIDTQGSELEVLKGFGLYLKRFKYLLVEVSEIPIYKGGKSAQQVTNWLSKHGFIQDSPFDGHNDVMYVRKGLK